MNKTWRRYTEKLRDKIINQIRKDFEFLDALGVVVYGSFARREPFSDIDVCVVLGRSADVGEMRGVLKSVWRNVNVGKKNYDAKLFEELPLHVKMEVVKDCQVVVGSRPEIYAYFYKFRKIWEDQKHRQSPAT